MKHSTGFTLLEVLVAIALASILLTSIYGVFTAASTAKQQVEKQANALHLGRVVIARLDRELLGLAMTTHAAETILSGGQNEQGEAFIRLLTWTNSSPQPGLRVVTYRLGPDPDRRMTLWRTEKSVYQRAEAGEERLAQGIEAMTFEFYDGQNWRESWSTGRPKLVRLRLTLQDRSSYPPLVSVFDMPQAGRLL